MGNSCRYAAIAVVAPFMAAHFLSQVPEEKARKLAVMVSIRVRGNGLRTNPTPLWVSAKWLAAEDAPFRAISTESKAALSDPNTITHGMLWETRARRAFAAWLSDFDNPLLLFRATTYFQVARTLSNSFLTDKDFRNMYGALNDGWNIQLKIPQSYEVCRRAYIFNAGDNDFHKHRDLCLRLLKRDPFDRSVIIAMVAEYSKRKFPREYEEKLFSSLEAISRRPDWRPWDHWTWGRAFRTYGHLHRKKESYDTAIAKAEIALKNTPKGWDPAPLKKWIAETKNERDDPNFGWLPGAKHIDDIDPY